MPDSDIQFECPQCMTSISVAAEFAGQRVECPKCKRSLLAPNLESATQSIFDDLFDGDSELVMPSDATEPTTPPDSVPAPTPSPPSTDQVESVPVSQEAAAGSTVQDKSPTLEPIDESLFADIDSAINTHRTSGVPDELIGSKDDDGNDPSVQEVNVEESPEPIINPLADLSVELPNELPEQPMPVTQTLSDQEDDFSLEEHLDSPELDLAPIADDDKDPFEVDDNEPLKIEGISPKVKSSEIYGVKCSICDTRIHVTESQIGDRVECPECYSPVVVTAPTTDDRDLMKQADADELRLAPPEVIEKPQQSPIDPSFGLASDARDLLAPINPTPEEAEDNEPELLLEDVQEVDLLADVPSPSSNPMPMPPLTGPSSTPAPQMTTATPGNPPETPSENTSDLFSAATQTAPRRKPPQKESEPEYGSKDYWAAKVADVEVDEDGPAAILLQEKISPADYAGWVGKSFSSADVIFRSLLAMACLGITYWMYDIFHASFHAEDVEKHNKILSIVFPIFFGGGALIAGALVLLTTCSMVFQNSVNGVSSLEDWPGFSFGDWFGPVMYFGFSMWLTCIPGALFGLLMSVVTEIDAWIIISASFTSFLLGPLLLMNACYSGSAFMIFNKDVFNSFSGSKIDWLWYLPYALGLWVFFAIGTGIMYLPTVIFATMGAAVHVCVLVGFAAIIGLFCGWYVTHLQKKNGVR